MGLYTKFKVSIAFRHSPRSRPLISQFFQNFFQFCLHCLSAFTTFPTIKSVMVLNRLRKRSPLPFGIHHVPDQGERALRQLSVMVVSIAFRHSPRSRPYCRATSGNNAGNVSIAFRHSPRSRRQKHDYRQYETAGLHCLSAFTTFPTQFCACCKNTGSSRVSIAFRHSPRSRPSPRHFVIQSTEIRLHCLSAFTTFPTRPGWVLRRK